jgi:hypothetical protein
MRWPVIFALATAVCWGLYGPALGKSRAALHSPFTPYVAIGLAYLFWGVGGGVLGMMYNGDSFSLSGPGGVWGFIAGTLGAWGAFTLTLAMFSGGMAMPNIVMPVVFGGAVTVSALVSLYSLGDKVTVNPLLYVGIVGMFVCIVIVAYFTPHAAPHGKPATAPPAADAPADSE